MFFDNHPLLLFLPANQPILFRSSFIRFACRHGNTQFVLVGLRDLPWLFKLEFDSYLDHQMNLHFDTTQYIFIRRIQLLFTEHYTNIPDHPTTECVELHMHEVLQWDIARAVMQVNQLSLSMVNDDLFWSTTSSMSISQRLKALYICIIRWKQWSESANYSKDLQFLAHDIISIGGNAELAKLLHHIVSTFSAIAFKMFTPHPLSPITKFTLTRYSYNTISIKVLKSRPHILYLQQVRKDTINESINQMIFSPTLVSGFLREFESQFAYIFPYQLYTLLTQMVDIFKHIQWVKDIRVQQKYSNNHSSDGSKPILSSVSSRALIPFKRFQ